MVTGPGMELVRTFDFENCLCRIIEKDGELLIPRVDVARALGYKNPEISAANLVNRNPDDFDGCQRVIKLVTHSRGEQSFFCLTERGVYTFTFLARTPLAARFRRQVADLLEGIRKGQYVIMDQYRLLELEIERIKAETEQRRVDLEQARLNALSAFLSAHAARISPTHLVGIVQSMTGHAIHVPRTYSSTEIAHTLRLKLNQNISPALVGRAANAMGLKPPLGEENEFAGYTTTKARGCDKTVYVPFYKEPALQRFEEYFRLHPVRSKKPRPLPVPGQVQLQFELPEYMPLVQASNA